MDMLYYKLCINVHISKKNPTDIKKRKESKNMKNRKLKQFSFIMVFVMVISFVVSRADFVGKLAISENKTELKHFTVSDKELDKIVALAKDSGSEAADMVNELKGDDFEAAVNKVLTEYYKNEKTDCLKAFKKKVDTKAMNIIRGYEEAAEERKNADTLPYEAGVSLVSFGADVSEKEIKDIVKDQYGECEYIH